MQALATLDMLHHPDVLANVLSKLRSIPDALATLTDAVSHPIALALLASTVPAYLLLVRARRWRLYNAVHAKYAHRIGTLTPVEAQEIVRVSAAWDMPALLIYALSFALMRTYAIPTISRILMQTKELKLKDTVSKRFLDTAILAGTMALCPLSASTLPDTLPADPHAPPLDKAPVIEDDPRAFIAIARTNWLHGHYPILNEDFLYTLSLFIREPIRWAERYGWRPLSPLESRFVLWKAVGEHMQFKDIPPTLEAMCEWSDAYEEAYAVPDQANHDLTSGMLSELVHTVPEAFGLRNFVLRIVYTLMEDRIREAMMFPAQPAWMHALVYGGMRTLAFAQRYLCLPRSKATLIVPLDALPAPKEAGKLARMHPDWKGPQPWYEAPRTGLARVWQAIGLGLGLVDPEYVPGPKWRSDGYRLEEIGPIRWENVGHAQVMKQAGELRGCPVTGLWARDVEVAVAANGNEKAN
ncbi:hypothetical protein OF83DRAFT_1177889 [Amylostereum chailletii]|nr:hypothetical protein OF83DRAFT_1177889 [Amylostereum chailletii]